MRTWTDKLSSPPIFFKIFGSDAVRIRFSVWMVSRPSYTHVFALLSVVGVTLPPAARGRCPNLETNAGAPSWRPSWNELSQRDWVSVRRCVKSESLVGTIADADPKRCSHTPRRLAVSSSAATDTRVLEYWRSILEQSFCLSVMPVHWTRVKFNRQQQKDFYK